MRKIISKLALNALNKAVESCLSKNNVVPKKGWIRTIREAFLLSSNELAERMGISYQSVLKFEKKELKGEVTMKKMQELADALDCEFVYYMVPKGGDFVGKHKEQVKEKAPGILD